MRHDTVLKSGLAGYIYRWLRNGGVVALVAGAAMIGIDGYHALSDGRAEATVTGIEIACVLKGEGLQYRAVAQEVVCSQADAMREANSSIPLVTRDVPYAQLSYRSEIGAEYTARLRLDDLRRPELQRGDSVAVTYNRNNPSEARAVADASSYTSGLLLISAGVMMLALIWVARRAVSFETGVDAEVAALEAAYAARKTAARRR